MKTILIIISAIIMFEIFSSNARAESCVSISTTPYATINALYNDGNYLYVGTEFGVTKLNLSNGGMEFFCNNTSGLPSETPNAIVIESSGAVWIGYNDEVGYEADTKPGGGGLAKFDGTSAAVFDKHTSELPRNTILCLAANSNGTVWIGTEGGLTKYDGTAFTVYDKSNSDLIHNIVNAVTVDDNGTVYFGTNAGFGTFDGETWTGYNTWNSDIPGHLIKDLDIDDDGNVWIGSPSGLILYDGETWTLYKNDVTGLASFAVMNVDIDSQGTVWICTGEEFASFDGETWTAYTPENSDIPDKEIMSFEVAEDGSIWIGTYDKLYKFDGTDCTEQPTGILCGDDTWSRIADMPTNRWALGTAVVDGKIYAIGGTNETRTIVDIVEEYDPAAGTWSTKAPLPTRRTAMGVAVVNNKIYAIGGYQGGVESLSTVEQYDPTTDTWAQKADMPTPRDNLKCCVLGGKIYAIGGYPDLATVEVYDPATDSWEMKASMQQGRWDFALGEVNGKFYAMGGVTGTEGLNEMVGLGSVEVYDPASDSWTAGKDLPTIHAFPACGVDNGKIYITGGASLQWEMEGIDNYPRVTEVYDPATDSWEYMASMPVNRLKPGSCMLDGKMYVIGGSMYVGVGSTEGSLVYVYDTPEKSTGVESVHVTTPNTFSLSQNYPNPFNPSTVISYNLDRQGLVNLVIYDILGRKVETLVETNQGPGSYSVRWDADGLASGVYFYQIDIEGKSHESRRMMLMK